MKSKIVNSVVFVSSVLVGCFVAWGQLFNLFVEKTESLSQYEHVATLLHHKSLAESTVIKKSLSIFGGVHTGEWPHPPVVQSLTFG